MALRIFKRLREMLDVDVDAVEDGDALVWDEGAGMWVPGAGGGGGGAPTDVNYLVGTADSGLSAEIVVGTSPGGELGGTWASPTVDATHSGSSHASVQAAAEATAAGALSSHASDTTGVHGIADTSALVLTGDSRLSDARTPTGSAGGVLGGTYPNPSFASDMATQAELDAHLNDTSDAHDASAISIADAGNDFTATDVEGALAELQSDHETDAQNLADHLADTSAAHAASAISFSPQGSIAATDVQAAIQEVRDEATGIAATLLDAKGDLIVASAADTAARLAVGGTNGMGLQVASGESVGVKWDLPPGFEMAYAQITSNVTVDGTSEGAANTIVTAGAFTADGTSAYLIQFFTPFARPDSTTSGNFLDFWLYEDGSSIGRLANMQLQVSGVANLIPFSLQRRLVPSSGSRTYSIRASVNTGTGVVVAGAGGSGAQVPAFIRITKV